MNLPDLKALDKIIALCRKRGVKSIKIDNVELTLSEDAPAKASPKSRKATPNAPSVPASEPFDSDLPSELDLLFYSSGGVPEELKEGN